MHPDSSASVRSLTQAVKAEAHRLGFHLVGVTTPDPPPHRIVFENWLSEGKHGEMAYLAEERARQRRADPRLILPECQSILVLGLPYPASLTGQNKLLPLRRPRKMIQSRVGQAVSLSIRSKKGVGAAGRMASYAMGMDYHAVISEKLKALVAFMERQAGRAIPNRWYTDTGPILERDLAQRAGLGWIGKNTCLIAPDQGSYFFLSEILLGIELAVDPPFLADRCGTCTRCLEACPTSCILPDRTLDARRCISYLTIELKGPIPDSLRPQLGDWVFGCDVCQQVCPWNIRFASGEYDPAFAPPPEISGLDLEQILSLSQADFSRLFKGSPVKRTRRSGFLRNAAVVLGNRADPQAINRLSQSLLSDPDPLVRGHAAWALGQIKDEAAGTVLSQAEELETDPFVREEIQRAIS
jgi:epoxyqueuosine reductase